MLWNKTERSRDLEDQRDDGGAPRRIGGGGIRIGLGGVIILGIASLIFQKDLLTPVLLNSDPTYSSPSQAPMSAGQKADEEPMVRFVSFVLDDTQDTWEKIFAQQGKSFRRAKLVLFRDSVESGCGSGEAASGPFYCPQDQRAYIDLSFYAQLKSQFGAAGDFAQAYVLAHELGHHVQNLLGTAGRVEAAAARDPSQAGPLSVRLELQADCFAGIWAHATSQRGLLEGGDVEEAMRAAAAVGDDNIAKMSGRRISPESFSHGSSAQRMEWFKRGLESGRVESCDTFAG